MTKSKYIEAAEVIGEGEELFCCHALNRLDVDECEFLSVFRPKSHQYEQYSDECLGIIFGSYANPENQLARSLALLFMAEMTSKPTTKPTKRKGRKK